MKKSTLTIIILLLSIFTYGQGKKFGFTLQVSSPSDDNVKLGWFNIDQESKDGYNLKHRSFAGGFLANYNINNETTLRLRFGITKYFIDEYGNINLNGILYSISAKGKQNKIHFAPGIIWNMHMNKLNLFGGFELPINLHGEFTFDNISISKDSLTGNIISDRQIKTTLPKGNSFGIGAIMGFNYFPANWFSLGAEFSPSLLYAKLSGKTTTISIDNLTPANSNTSYTQDEDKGFTFYDQRFSINFSIWF